LGGHRCRREADEDKAEGHGSCGRDYTQGRSVVPSPGCPGDSINGDRCSTPGPDRVIDGAPRSECPEDQTKSQTGDDDECQSNEGKRESMPSLEPFGQRPEHRSRDVGVPREQKAKKAPPDAG
jgi:hypothetical protein